MYSAKAKTSSAQKHGVRRLAVLLCLLSMACNTLRPAEQVLAICLPHGAVSPVQPMTLACEQYLESLIHIHGNEENDPNGLQKKQLLQSMYTLLAMPVSWPLERNVYGVAPALDFLSADLLAAHQKYPTYPIQNLFFDYIVQSTSSILIEPDMDQDYNAYFDPISQIIHFVTLPTSTLSLNRFPDLLTSILRLIHESRHSAYWDHEIYCPEWSTSVNACDWGTNKPHGWTASYLWGLLQSHRDDPLQSSTIQQIACGFSRSTGHLYGLPTAWAPIAKNYALPGVSIPNLDLLVSTEELSWAYRDFYKELVHGQCGPDHVYENSCATQIRSLLHITASPEWSQSETELTTQTIVLILQFILSHSPQWNTKIPLIGLDTLEHVIDKKLQESFLSAQHPTSFIVNYLLQNIDEFILGRAFKMDPYDFCSRAVQIADPIQPTLSSMADLLVDLLEKARRPQVWWKSKKQCNEWGLSQYCDRDITGGHGWSASIAWGFFNTDNPAMQDSSMGASIAQAVCIRLQRIASLPDTLLPIRGIDCQKISKEEMLQWK